MTLKTQMLRGLFALPLLAMMLIAHAVLADETAARRPLDVAVERLIETAELAAEQAPACSHTARGAGVGRWLISTPADLPLRVRSREPGCPRT